MAKVLVTGGCGYIGSHVVQALSEQGHEAVVYDNLSTGFADALTYGETLIVGAMEDQALLEATVAAGQFDAIMHFAASIVVPESVEKPLLYYSNNTVNLINLLKVATEHGVNNLIFSSTAAVYGNGDGKTPFSETDALNPESPYGFSKMFSEQVIRDTHKACGLNYVILRYFNVAGADPKGRIGQRTPNATHLIKIACETATGKRPAMTIFGDDYATPDGTCVRDFIHISDLADAHVQSLEHLLNGGESQLLNCGYGQGYSVRQVLEAIDDVVGIKVPRTVVGRRPGDAVVVLARPDRIKKVLPWKPRFTSIRTIVEHAYRWEQHCAAQGLS